MPADWQIRHWPRCSHHVFLSHCAEDRDTLVIPLREWLESSGIITWIDRHDYPSGRDPFEVLREELLRCRHVVYLLTPAAMKQGRGWTQTERAYAEVVQQTLCFNGQSVAHFELPLFLCDYEHKQIPRSIWRTLIDKGRFHGGKKPSRKSQIEWCAREIVRFVKHEQFWGGEIGERIERDAELNRRFASDPNLFGRIIAAHPPPIPLE